MDASTDTGGSLPPRVAQGSRLDRVVALLPVLMALGAVGLYAGTALSRMSYPFELEWEEGSILTTVQRVLTGQPVYVPPSLEFIPWAYAPGFYYASALACLATGPPSLPVLRLVSFAASLGSLFFVGLLAHRVTRRRADGLLAAGLFAATYQVSGTWFDLARVDSLFLCLLLAGTYAAARGRDSLGWALASGALFAASILTKQTAFAAAALMLAWLVWMKPHRGMAAIGVFGVAFGCATLYLNLASDGWYGFYTWTVPSRHGFVWPNVWRFWTRDLASMLPVLTLLTVVFLAAAAVRRRDSDAVVVALTAGLAFVSWGSRCHHGGYVNTLMPIHAGLALAAVCALDHVRERPAAGRAVYALLALQFAFLAYDPRPLIPAPGSLEAGHDFVRRLEAIEGEVFMPSSGYLATMAGKRAYAHSGQINDILRSGLDEFSEPLKAEMTESARAHRFEALVFDAKAQQFLGGFFLDAYERLPGSAFEDENVFRPVTGVRSRPEGFFVPKGSGIIADDGH